MKRVCAWCKKDLGTKPAMVDDGGAITHGICKSCVAKYLPALAKPLPDFLDRLGVPVLLMGSGPKVLTANRHARELLGKNLSEIEGHRSGEVIECIYSKRPGGCGEQEHCKSCAIRQTVLETYRTGKGFVKVRAYPDIQFGETEKTMSIEITTQKVKGYVLLRIDDLREKE
ncbi:MAG: hypothetical protein GXP25_15245 [Planctomycetes bacterium]|nr:hypothetical protein [Planctomycetota bacterium]